MDSVVFARLAASEVDADRFSDLVREGEQLFVERKRSYPPPEHLGAEVASMANTLGGWILVGVKDRSGQLYEAELPRGDLQSNVGNHLRNVLDPVPPFVARELEVDGIKVAFIRVFESSTRPVLCSDGRVYGRDAGGKRPVSDHRELLDLAESGRRRDLLRVRRARVPLEAGGPTR